MWPTYSSKCYFTKLLLTIILQSSVNKARLLDACRYVCTSSTGCQFLYDSINVNLSFFKFSCRWKSIGYLEHSHKIEHVKLVQNALGIVGEMTKEFMGPQQLLAEYVFFRLTNTCVCKRRVLSLFSLFRYLSNKPLASLHLYPTMCFASTHFGIILMSKLYLLTHQHSLLIMSKISLFL